MKQNIRIFKLYLQILLHYFFWIQKKEFIAILYPSTCLNIRLIFIDIFKKKKKKNTDVSITRPSRPLLTILK